MKSTSHLQLLDLFAGSGGLSLGFDQAGFKTSFMIDSCPQSVETLKKNFQKNNPLVFNEDLEKFTPLDFKRNIARKDIDIIIGGPPCQGWSLAGRAKIRSLKEKVQSIFDDPRNRLYKKFINYVKVFQPVVCLMENVPGMTSHTNINVADRVARDITRQGYNVTWEILDAVNYGVPQKRKRIFFIGVRKDLNLKFIMPKWLTSNKNRLYPLRTVRDAIMDLPRLNHGARKWIRSYNSKKKSEYSEKLRRGCDRNIIQDHVCRTHNKQDIEAFKIMKQGDWYKDLPKQYKRYRDDIFQDKYKKLIWEEPSWCVTAHLSKDGFSHIHPSQQRSISVREAARLQSFPDDFQFGGSGMLSKFRLIGNAVPPLMAEVIAKEIKRQVF